MEIYSSTHGYTFQELQKEITRMRASEIYTQFKSMIDQDPENTTLIINKHKCKIDN